MGVERVIQFGLDLMGLSSFPIFVCYLVMVFMAKIWTRFTHPLQLRWVLVVYNMCCSAAGVLSFAGLTYGITQMPSVFDMSPGLILKPFYAVYWITKIVELLDTVFMILRHKGRQITFLHVFHHSSMLILSEYAYYYAPWAAVAMGLSLNSFIHVVLYFYYGLTALDPDLTKSWKRRVTELQIAQFIFDLVYGTIGYLYHGFCIYCIFYGLSMLGLFSNFYLRAYVSKRQALVDKKRS